MGRKSREKKLQRYVAVPGPVQNKQLLQDIREQPVLYQGLALLVFIGLCILLFYPPYMRAMFFTREQLPTHLLTYALFILWWAVKYLRRDSSFLREPLDYLVFAFVLAYVLSFTVAINIRGAIQEFLKVGNYFLVYWLVSELGRTRKEASLVLLNVLMLSALGVAVLGLGAAAGTWEVAGGYIGGRIFSTIQYPNSLAAYLTGAFLVSLALWQTAGWKLRQFYAVAAFLLLVTAILTYSRGGWLVMPVFSLLYIVLMPRGRRLDGALFIGVVAAVAAGLIASPGRAAAQAGSLWLWIFAGCLAVLAGQYLLIDIRKRIKPVFLLGTAGLLSLLLVGAISGYVYRTLAAPMLLAQSGLEQLIAVRPGMQYNLTMEVLATEEGEAPFAWQLTVLEQRKDNSTAALVQETGRQTQGWEKRSFTFTTTAEAKRVLVRLQSVHPGTSVEARDVTLAGDGSRRRLDFAWNRLLPGLLYSRLLGLDRERNVQERFVFFRDAWEIIKDYPWRGLGGHAWSSIYFQYQSAPYSTTEVHNHFLQVWIETGIIGFLIFAGIWLLFIFTSYRLYRGATPEQKVLITGIAAGVLAVVAHSVYDFNLSLGAIGMFVFALMGVIRSFVPEQRVVSAHRVVYKPVLAVFVALGLAVFVIRLMVANGAMEEGISWMRRGRLNQGVQAFEQAVRHDPFDPQMRLMLAEAYENKGLQTENPVYYGKASEQYTAALNNNRYHPRFSHSLGAFLVRSGQFDRGLAYLQQTIKLHPRFVGHYRIYASTVLNVAQFFLRKDDQAAAQSYLERVFASDRQVQERFGDPFSLAFAVGQAHFMLGDAEQAVIYLERALISGEDKPHALMVLSLIYERKGDSIRAGELHGQALGLDPASEGTYQAFKNL
jgi:Tfp pilus assembly protein PilF/O-antigen ligase